MILFRVRRYGSADWIDIRICSDLSSDEDLDMEEEVAEVFEASLTADDLHLQRMSEEGKWEDLE